MASSVTAPLERQFGQVPGLKQMTSTSSFGSSVITLQFSLDLNIDIAEQEVQAAINASGTYPAARSPESADLQQDQSRRRADPDAGPDLEDDAAVRRWRIYADTRLAQKISQLPGVGLVSISGGQRPAVRIQANPNRARRIRAQSGRHPHRAWAGQRQSGQGQHRSSRQAFTIGANDQLLSSKDYGRSSSRTETARPSVCPMSRR